jgi:hypothetical protein
MAVHSWPLPLPARHPQSRRQVPFEQAREIKQLHLLATVAPEL